MYYLYTLIGLSILFSIAAIVSAVLYWRDDTEGRRPFYYLLAHLAILLVASFVLQPVALTYRAAIILGLLLSLLAALLHRFLRAPASIIHAFDLVVILLYMAAFAALHPAKWPTPWLLLPLLLGGLCYWALFPRFAELGTTFAGYGIALLLMSWQALELVVVQPALWTWLALLGALGLAMLKAILAIDHAYTEVGDRPFQSLPRTQWAWATGGGSGLPRRLIEAVLGLQTLTVQLIERINLPTLARKSIAILPLLTLLCQWLLALSVWGPALVRFAP